MESSAVLSVERRRAILLTLVMLLPFGLSALFVYGSSVTRTTNTNAPPQKSIAQATGNDRLILIIVDSLRREDVDQLMPNLKTLAHERGSVFINVHTAVGNMSLPCIQTLLEGRESPYASAIHDFTGQRGLENNSLPAAAARAGLKPALIADFIILGLYGQYGTITANRPELAKTELDCDLAAIDKTIEILSDHSVRLIILHVGGTDAAAHRWGPGHPEYERHFRAVDAKLSVLVGKLDFTSDQLVVTGDHGHNERGNHTPWSVAIFAGGIYPPLFAALGSLGQLQQVDMLFFLALPFNLPLPINYEGRYFGIETPIDSASTSSDIRRRLDTFRKIQADTLNGSSENLPNIIGRKRAEARSMSIASFEHALPLLLLFLGWIAAAFRINSSPNGPMWPLIAIVIPAVAVWFCPNPILSVVLAFLIGTLLLFWAIKAGEVRRLCFLLLLLAGAAWSAFDQERSQRLFLHHSIVALFAAGAVIVLLRERGLHGWPVALCAIALFVLPSGGFKTQLAPNILRAWLLGGAVLVVGAIVTRRFRQVTPTPRIWIAFCVLLIVVKLLRGQRSDIGRMHNILIDWLARHSATGLVLSAILYFGCALYLIWVVRRRGARILLASTLLILPVYSAWFAQLPFAILAVVSVVPVFFASWVVLLDTPSPLQDRSELATERAGLFLATTLVMTFWMLFQGFFIQEIDFSFALKYLPEKVSGLTEMAVAFPLTWLKYALPLILVVFVFTGLRGVLAASQALIGGLIFCNLKLAALLIQIFVGPLGTREKFYELAMSDFVFVSQIVLIVALTYIGLLLFAPLRPQQTSIPSATR